MHVKNIKTFTFVVTCLLIITCQQVAGQSDQYFGEKQLTPKIPPKEERIRVIIVSDATNEIDDVWAIALAILYPERFDIEGFVGSNYDHTSTGVGPKSIAMSVNEIHTILAKAGMKGKYPVYAGAHPMQYEFAPSGAEGVDFIVERALAGTPDNPLWVIGLGAPTDLASAYLQEPAIKDRVVMFWHARTENTWPYRAHNYNIMDYNFYKTNGKFLRCYDADRDKIFQLLYRKLKENYGTDKDDRNVNTSN